MLENFQWKPTNAGEYRQVNERVENKKVFADLFGHFRWDCCVLWTRWRGPWFPKWTWNRHSTRPMLQYAEPKSGCFDGGGGVAVVVVVVGFVLAWMPIKSNYPQTICRSIFHIDFPLHHDRSHWSITSNEISRAWNIKMFCLQANPYSWCVCWNLCQVWVD